MKSASGCVKAVLCGVVIGILCTSGRNAFGFSDTETAADPLKLDQVVVSATKTEHTIEDVPAVVNVVTREEIERKQVQTVQEALKLLPGVKVNQTSSGWGDKGKVQIQGMDEGHTLILVDGQRYLGGHGDAVDIQSIPINMVERIEVVQGPSSSLYGSDAMGGVVNIITKAPGDKTAFSGSAAFGNRSTRIHEATGDFRSGGFGSSLGYTYRESNGVEKETDRYKEHLLRGTLSYDFSPSSRIAVRPFYSLHEMSYEDRRQVRAGVNPSWEYAPDNLSKLSVKGSAFDYKHYTADRATDWDTDNYEGEAVYSRLFFGNHMVTAGYQYTREEIDDRGKDYTGDQYLNSYFFQDEMSFGPVTLVLGGRLDDHDLWGTEFNPKASVMYNATKSLKVLASVGTAFRGPTLVKLYGDLWRMGPYTVHANPDLEPEESIGYQLGVEYSRPGFFVARVNLFRNEIENLIDYTVERVGSVRNMYWVNVNEANTQGVEFGVTGYFAGMTAKGAYTFLETEDETLNRELTYRPRHKASMELDRKFSSLGLGVNVTGEYTGSRVDSDYERLGGYFLWNAAVTKELGKRLQLFARVDNIFGKEEIDDEYDLDGTRFLAGLKLVLK